MLFSNLFHFAAHIGSNNNLKIRVFSWWAFCFVFVFNINNTNSPYWERDGKKLWLTVSQFVEGRKMSQMYKVGRFAGSAGTLWVSVAQGKATAQVFSSGTG